MILTAGCQNKDGSILLRAKTWMIMKLTIAFLLFFTFQVSANGYAQKITIVKKNASLTEIFKAIERQTGFLFFYDKAVIQKAEPLDIAIKDATLDQALSVCLKGQELTYSIVKNTVVIRPEKKTYFQTQATLTPMEDPEVPPIEIHGRVVNQQGEPLQNVSVLIAGTQIGTTTNNNGRFTLTAPDDRNVILEVSSVGYQTKKVNIGKQTEVNVVLELEVSGLSDVVVVGYGTQKKENLTGSVSTINEANLAATAQMVTQTSQLLSGAVSGVTAMQSSGKPGSDQTGITIRGKGTFSGAGNSPLIIVDGIPSDINSVNPIDIKSVSVLKDAASAAIYGSRAANGVILITTKEGKPDELRVTYNSYVGIQRATQLPQFVDSKTYAEMLNEAMVNIGSSPVYTQEAIDKFGSGVDLDGFPNVSHLKDLFNSGDGIQTKHNLSFMGGAENTRYLVSAGYLKQDGLVDKNSYERYDMRINLNSNLRNNLKLNTKIFGFSSTASEPAYVDAPGRPVVGIEGLINVATHTNATIPGKKSDGTYGLIGGHPVYQALMESISFGKTKGMNINAQTSLAWDITKHLNVTGRVGYIWNNSKNRLYGSKVTINPGYLIKPNQLNVTQTNSSDLVLDLIANYNRKFQDHALNVLLGTNVEQFGNEVLTGFRDNFPSDQLYYLSAGSSANWKNGETAENWKLRSYFGRVNYSFKDKYLVEGDIRIDGSSRFSKSNRYGVFPSVSAGWILSKENFFNVPWIQLLKVRGSYGELGNQNIGVYPYQKVLNLGGIYATGQNEVVQPAVVLNSLPFDNISWETTRITDVGLDLSLFGNTLTVTTDYYYKRTNGILYNLTVSRVLGMTVGNQNAGVVSNEGWNLELSYKNSIGGLSFKISPNFSVNKNEVVSLAGVKQDINQGLFIGEPIGAIYGYKTDGLFIDQRDIDGYAAQGYATKPGYPRFMDISGDGKVTASDDRTIIGNTFPKYNYGLEISADFKGFDLFLQLSGKGGYQTELGGNMLAFSNDGNIQQWHVDDRWTVNNPDPKAKYPRLEKAVHAFPWDVNLSYWIRDASFLRVSTLQLGYNFSLPKKSALKQLRIYLDGKNLFTIDNFARGWDPEMAIIGTTVGSATTYYPPTTLFSLGVNVQF
jgi:TonB-linked SusC/RagA family outer membrane protein